ncbi:MAG: hypothetical protein WCK31_00420 [bacterium]
MIPDVDAIQSEPKIEANAVNDQLVGLESKFLSLKDRLSPTNPDINGKELETLCETDISKRLLRIWKEQNTGLLDEQFKSLSDFDQLNIF